MSIKPTYEELEQRVKELEQEVVKHKQAEMALRESEQFLNIVISQNPFPIWIGDSKGTLLKCNKSLLDLLQLEENQLVGKYNILKDPLVKHLHEDIYKIFDKGKTFKFEVQWEAQPSVGVGSSFVIIAGVVFPIFNQKGEIVNTVATYHDITALRKSEETFRAIVENVPVMINSFDENGKCIIWNKELKKQLGYTISEVNESDNALELVYSKKEAEKIHKNILRKDGKFRVFHPTSKNGEKKIQEWADVTLPDGRGVSIGVDITEHKLIEKEKRKALEFAATQSKHAVIGQVSGKMAHDFNNVLAGIMGNAQLAIMDCDDEKTKLKLERINEFSERGRDITNTLISFSKDQETKQTNFKIEDKIDLVLKMLEKDLEGIDVSRNYKLGIPELLADPGMIQDALTNIIQNSIHAMSNVEKPTLKLKAYSQDDKVHFEIEDNGCGIPKEHQNSIYTPSFTLKGGHDKTRSYKSEIKGTGYGMSNVKKYIVEKHKGDISLESQFGKGTKITIALKIIKNQLSSVEKKEVLKSQIYDKRRILLVEDEPAIADVQYQILTKEPFSHIVSMAVNGQAAIDAFDRNKFDAVSLDYMLPGNINGLDVYNHIKKNDKDIPIMFISGNIEFLESIQKLREKDPNLEHLSKPVDNLDYVNKINELIAKSIKS